MTQELKRSLWFGIGFLAILLSLFFLKSQRADAWVPAVPQCSLPADSWDWKSALDAVHVPPYNIGVPNFAPEVFDNPFIIYKVQSEAFYRVSVMGWQTATPERHSLEIRFLPSSTTDTQLYYVSSTATADAHMYTLNFTTDVATRVGTGTGGTITTNPILTNNRYADLNPTTTCIVSFNGTYAAGYNKIIYPEFQPDNAPPQNDGKDCSLIDIPCLIIAGVKYLFQPDTELVTDYVTDLYDFLEEKLGVLFFPAEFVVEFYDLIDNPCSVGAPNFCNEPEFTADGEFFGKEVSIQFGVYLGEHNGVTNLDRIKIIIRAFLIFTLITGLYYRYKAIVHKGSTA